MVSDLEALIAQLDGEVQRDALKAAAYFHARFAYIRPFADGNGRVGRTLMNYFLMIHDHPPVIVHGERKGEYYAALESYDREETISPLRALLESETCEAWEKTLKREATK